MFVISACSRATAGPAALQGLPADSVAQIEALYRARADSARTLHTNADVRFMTRMIAHHAQALEVARLAPDRTENSQLRTLAARIINAQSDEIATMQGWLRDRGQPVPSPDTMATHADHGGGDPPAMPGMVTAEQMNSLEQAEGLGFDRLFLSLMIHHHSGAVEMVEELFTTDGAAQDEEVFKFASDAQVDQRTEIDRMERMLESLLIGGPAR
ncbi:MAG: DUF305 domain-containing protein [Gemmatimonas sp.]|nr:DUF305 domain-containing protein [Gemmatimonas sp.]